MISQRQHSCVHTENPSTKTILCTVITDPPTKIPDIHICINIIRGDIVLSPRITVRFGCVLKQNMAVLIERRRHVLNQRTLSFANVCLSGQSNQQLPLFLHVTHQLSTFAHGERALTKCYQCKHYCFNHKLNLLFRQSSISNSSLYITILGSLN